MNTVYADVLFLINFSVDFMALYLTGRALRRPLRRWRLILTSVLLSLYALWALLLCSTYLLLILTAVASGVVGCVFALKCEKVREGLITCFVFLGISSALGGILLLLYRVMATLFTGVSMRDNGMKVLVFTLLTAVSGILIALGNHFLTDVRGTKAAEVTVTIAGRHGTFHLLVDSGNLVRDPIGGRSVIFVKENAAVHAFGEEIRREDFLPERRRAITMTTANGKGILLAYRPDAVCIGGRTVDALVALLPHLSVKQYDGIFPAGLL